MAANIRKQLKALNLTDKFAKYIKYRISTGIEAIDRVTYGGIPSGKITEIYGGWSAGKTRLVLHILAQTLKFGGWAILIDTERALEAGLCDLVGLDVKHKKFIYIDPDEVETMEDVFAFAEKAIDAIREDDPEALLCIGFDSLAATPTREDIDVCVVSKKEGDIDISKNINIAAARRAKLVGRGIRRLSSKVFKTNTCFIIVNQLVDRFDVMFGDKTTTPGGKAAKFHASLRVKLSLVRKIKDKQTKEQVGNSVKLVIEKSRIGFPFGEVHFDMLIKEQIDKYAGLIDYMLRHEEVIKQSKHGIYCFVGEEEEWTAATFPEHYEKRKEKMAKKEEKKKEK